MMMVLLLSDAGWNLKYQRADIAGVQHDTGRNALLCVWVEKLCAGAFGELLPEVLHDALL